MDKDKILLPHAVNVRGRVCIEYKDKLTGKVKERIDSGNHVFLDSFKSGNWADILNSAAYETFFMTDDNTPPDDNLPYLRGNIVGWGRIGAGASGSYQGNYITSQSWLDQDRNGGHGRSWKYTYEFGSNQIPGTIKSVGISTQFATIGTAFLLSPIRSRKYTANATGYFYRNNKGYKIANTGVITVYDPFTNTSQTINISAITGTSSTLSIGFDADSSLSYILAYSSTAANRRMYKFVDESFQVLLETTPYSALTSYPSTNYLFVVKGARLWYYASTGWYSGDYVANINPTLITPPVCVFNTALSTVDSYTSMTTKAGVVFILKETGSSTRGRFPIWDLINNKQFGTISPIYSTASHLHCPCDPAMDNRVILMSSNATAKFYMKQALCCYVIPDGAHERILGDPMSVSYQIDIDY